MSRILVTGGTRGIGRAVVERLYAQGHQVAFCYQSSREQAELLAKQLPGVIPVQADVSQPEQVEALFAKVKEQWGGLDALVCNAGVALPQQLITQTSYQEFVRLMDVNVGGTFLCCQKAAEIMVSAHRGSIVTLSSMWGEVGASCEVAYSASKGAIISLTKALAKELGPSGIRVNCVSPGVIDTDMNGHLSARDMAALQEEIPLMRIGTPEDVAQAVAFLCSEEAPFITGQVLAVNGGMV